MQKLQGVVAKAETLSNEALRATQAESARAAQAEAVRYAQTEAVVDSLLAFKQTHAAELAKRDAAIAELQSVVGKLQGHHLQQQGFPERQHNPAEGHSQTVKAQEDDIQRLERAADGQNPTSISQQDPIDSPSDVVGHQMSSHKAAGGPVKGGLERKAAFGLLKGKTRHSIDGISRQGPKATVKAKAISSRAALCLLKGGPSTPQGVLSTQTDQQQRRPLAELTENEVGSLVKSFLLDVVLLLTASHVSI